MLIRSIRHKGLKRLVEEDNPRGIRPELVNRVRNILTVLILADSISDFINTAPSGWRVHRLSGDRRDTWSISITGNWRITFREVEGGLVSLDMEDYH